MMAADEKQEQLLNDLASFYASNSNFDFTPPGSPVKVTPPTSDSEQDPQQVAEVQRNVFIKSQDIASRRRKPHPSNNRKQPSLVSSHAAHADENASVRRRRTRPTSSVGTGQTSRPNPRRSKSSEENPGASKPDADGNVEEQSLKMEVPLKEDSAGGSALEKLKRRSNSFERSRPAPNMSKSDGLPEVDSSRRSNSRDASRRARRRKTQGEDVVVDDAAQVEDRGDETEGFHSNDAAGDGKEKLKLRSNSFERRRSAPKRSKSDELAEMDSSRRSNSRDAGRRARRRKTEGEDDIARDAAQVKEPDDETEEFYNDNSGSSVKEIYQTGGVRDLEGGLGDPVGTEQEVPLKDEAVLVPDHRRQSLSERNEGASGVGRGSSGDHSRRRHRRRNSADAATVGSQAKSSEGSGHRRSIRQLGESRMDRSERSSTPLHWKETSPTASFKNEAGAYSEGSSSKSVTSSLDKMNQAAQLSSPDYSKESFQDVSMGNSIPRSSGSRNSKWSAGKHGMAFINNAKDQLEEEKRSGHQPRRDHRRTRDSSSRTGASTGGKESRSSRYGYKESRSRGSTAQIEGDEVQHRHSSSRLDHGSRSNSLSDPGDLNEPDHSVGEIQAEADSRRSRPRSSSKWSAIKERSVSRSKSIERPQSSTPAHDSGATSSPVKPLTRRNSDLDALSRNLGRVNVNVISKPSSQPNLARRSSDSSLSDAKNSEEEAAICEEALGEKTEMEETTIKPAPNLFQNLLGKSMLKKMATSAPSNNDIIPSLETGSSDFPSESVSEEAPPQTGTKPFAIKNLLARQLGRTDAGKVEKKGSRWGGLRTGMDFTSRLMKVTSDKKKHDPDPEISEEDEAEAASAGHDNDVDGSLAKQNRGVLWNLGLGVVGNNEKFSDGGEGDLGHGHISLSSFPEDMFDGPPDSTCKEATVAVAEGDPGEDPARKNEHYAGKGSESAGAGSLIPCVNENSDAVKQAEPDLFSIFEGESSTGQPDAFSVIASQGATSSAATPDRRGMLTVLAAPSMRFDFDKKTEVVTSRAQTGIIDEESEQEDSDDESNEIEEETNLGKQEVVATGYEVGTEEKGEGSVEMNENDDSEYEAETILSPLKFMQLKFDQRLPSSADVYITIHSLDTVDQSVVHDEDSVKVHGMKEETVDCEKVESPRDESNCLEEDKKEDKEIGASEEVVDEPSKSSLLDLEFANLCRELEASKTRASASREAVRELQQEIQKQTELHVELQRRLEETRKEMRKRRVCLEITKVS